MTHNSLDAMAFIALRCSNSAHAKSFLCKSSGLFLISRKKEDLNASIKPPCLIFSREIDTKGHGSMSP